MKIGEFRALAKEELPEAPWISKLLDPLNRFLLSVRAALANGLTFADNFNAEIRTVEFTTRATPGVVAAYVERSTSPQSFASGSTLPVLFDSEILDTASAYDPVTGLFTAPAAGLYSVSATVALAGLTAAGEMLLELRTGGGRTVRGSRHIIDNPWQSENVSAIVNLAAGESVGAFLYQSNGATRSTDATAGLTHFSVARLDAGGVPNPAFPVKWKSKVRGKVAGILVLRCVEVDERNEKPVLAALGIDWAQDGENTIIRNVAGLTGGKTYRLTVAALGG
jgi:hypothetical protein